MAKTTTPPEPAKEKRIKVCECGATLFQGPFYRGSFVNGAFVPVEEVYQCRHCHREYGQETLVALVERVIPL
jgi:hypothetical protein